MLKILAWLDKQKESAKMAWTVAVVIAALFGYKISATPVEDPVLSNRIATIEKTLTELNAKVAPTPKVEEKVFPLPNVPVS